MDIKALIIARGGSERVSEKNIRPFAGKNLLQLKIEQLRDYLPVVVNSENDEILAIAKSHGAEIIKRDAFFARSKTPMNQVYKNVAENIDSEYILFANCTSPLIQISTILDMLNGWDYMKIAHDSLNTVTTVQEFLWVDGKPLYNPDNQPRSQDIKGIYKINWAAAIIKRSAMIEEGRVLTKKNHLFQIPDIEGFDIDTEEQFIAGEALYAHYRG